MSIQFRYEGDKEKAQSLVPFAVRNLLAQMKSRMGLLKQKEEVYKDANGVIIRTRINLNGIIPSHEISISVPIVTLNKEISIQEIKELIFLVSGGEFSDVAPLTYAVFSYKQGELVGYELDMTRHLYQVYTNRFGEETGGATVASSPAYSFHYYTEGSVANIADGLSFNSLYGVYIDDLVHKGLCGLRASYEPILFNPDSLEMPIGKKTEGTYLASARRDWWITSTGEVRKNLRIEYDSSDKKAFYETENGTQIGSTVFVAHECYAAISDTEFIGLVNLTAPISNITTQQVMGAGGYVGTCPSYGVFGGSTDQIFTTKFQVMNAGKKFMFGPYLLLLCMGSKEDSRAGAPGIESSLAYWTPNFMEINYVTSVGLKPTLLSYDNKNGSSDEFIIIFSCREPNGSGTSGSGITQTGGGSIYLSINLWDWNSYAGDIITFYLAYKTKSMTEPVISTLDRYGVMQYGSYSHALLFNDFEPPRPCLSITGSTSSTLMQGTRIVAASSYITDKEFLYTYIEQNYVGDPSESTHMDESDPEGSNWEFSKRVLGIINRETDVREEFTLTDEILGPYKDIFDVQRPAGIGKHILKEE